jgi:hypothetical protein
MDVKNETYQYQWIINEGLLRDEGTLYGIAGANSQEKLEAIRNYYRIRKAAAHARRDQLEKEIDRLDKEVAVTPGGSGFNENQGRESDLVPIMLQLLLYGGICYFNFYLEIYWLSPAIHSIFICVGLYLFGLFSVFIGRSIMYNSASSLTDVKLDGVRREKWKIYFEEFAVPVVVSVFISVLPAHAYSLPISVIVALVFFLLFLLGGKGLVNSLFRARVESGRWFQTIRRKKDEKTRMAKVHALQEELNSAVSSLEELNGEEEYRINVFTSEYKLASQGRQHDATISVKKLA